LKFITQQGAWGRSPTKSGQYLSSSKRTNNPEAGQEGLLPTHRAAGGLIGETTRKRKSGLDGVPNEEQVVGEKLEKL